MNTIEKTMATVSPPTAAQDQAEVSHRAAAERRPSALGLFDTVGDSSACV
jgi:hypothetical protein